MTKNERILIETATALYKEYVDVMNVQINGILSRYLGFDVKKNFDSDGMAEQFKKMLEESIGYVRVVVPKDVVLPKEVKEE